jgi:hypothetical protein
MVTIVLEYDFIVLLRRTHIVINALSRLSNNTKPIGVHDQTTDASFVLYRA